MSQKNSQSEASNHGNSQGESREQNAANNSHEQNSATNVQDLILLAAQGDGDAWVFLVENYASRVFGLLAKQCGDHELAEELTQATFVKLVKQIENYQEQGKFESWLFRIAMNLLRDEMRRRKRQARNMDMSPASQTENSSGQSINAWQAVQHKTVNLSGREFDNRDPLEQITQSEQLKLVQSAIRELPEADQEILYLRHTAGLSFAQIAESLEQPLGTVLARGHRALKKLKKIMMEAENDPPPTYRLTKDEE